MRGKGDARRIGQATGEEVALQGGGDRALALVGRLCPSAAGALLGEALARGLGASALAQVVDLDEDREDLAVVLAYAPGEDRDREVLVARQLQLGGRGNRRAGHRGRQQRVEGQAIVLLDQRAHGHAADRAALRELLQRRVRAQQAAVAVEQRDARRRGVPGAPQQLVGALALAAVALEIAEDLDLRAQHERVERLEDVVDGAGLVAARDLREVAAQRRHEDDRHALRARRARGSSARSRSRPCPASGRRAGSTAKSSASSALSACSPDWAVTRRTLQRREHGLEREQVLAAGRRRAGRRDVRRGWGQLWSHTRIRLSSWSMSTGLVM